MNIMDTQTLLFYVALGIFVFTGAMLIMVFLFGLTISDTIKNPKGLMGLLLLSLLVPLSARIVGIRVFTRVYADSTVIVSSEISPLGGEQLLVSFVTDGPTVGYIINQLTDGTRIPYLPTYTVDSRSEHAVIIPANLFELGKVLIVAANQEVEISNNGTL